MEEKKRFQITEGIGVITRVMETNNDTLCFGTSTAGGFLSAHMFCAENSHSIRPHCDTPEIPHRGDVVHVLLEDAPKRNPPHSNKFYAITCRPVSVPAVWTYFLGGNDNADVKRLIIRCRIDYMSYDEEFKNCYKCEVLDRVYDTRCIVDKSRGPCIAEIVPDTDSKAANFFFVIAVVEYLDDLPSVTESSNTSSSLDVSDFRSCELVDDREDYTRAIGVIYCISGDIRCGISLVGNFVINNYTMKHDEKLAVGDVVEVVLRETPKRLSYARNNPFLAVSSRIVPAPPSLQILFRDQVYAKLIIRCKISYVVREDDEKFDGDFYKCEIYGRVRDLRRRVNKHRGPCIADLQLHRSKDGWTLVVSDVVEYLYQTIPSLPASFDEVAKSDQHCRTIGVITKTHEQLRFGFSPLGRLAIVFQTIIEEPKNSSELGVGDVVELFLGESPKARRDKHPLRALLCRRVPAPPSVEIYFHRGQLNVRCKITFVGFDEEANFNVYESDLCGKVHDMQRIVDQHRGPCIANLMTWPFFLNGIKTIVLSIRSVFRYCENATHVGHEKQGIGGTYADKAKAHTHEESTPHYDRQQLVPAVELAVNGRVGQGDGDMHSVQSPTFEIVDSPTHSRTSEESRESRSEKSWESLLRRVIKDRKVRSVLRTENPDLYEEVMDKLMD